MGSSRWKTRGSAALMWPGQGDFSKKWMEVSLNSWPDETGLRDKVWRGGYFIYHWLTGIWFFDWISTIYHWLTGWIHVIYSQLIDMFFFINHIQPFNDPRLRREIASLPRSTLERLLEGESLWCVWKLGRCRHIRQPNPSKSHQQKVRRIMWAHVVFLWKWGYLWIQLRLPGEFGRGILRFLRLEAFRLRKWIFWKVKVWLLLRSRDFSEVHIPCKGKRSESR